MKVKLIPEMSYRVETESGEQLGVFTKGEEWEGMTKFNNNSSTLIVQSEDCIERLFHRDNECRSADVVRWSGDLRERFEKVLQDIKGSGKTETETKTESTK